MDNEVGLTHLRLASGFCVLGGNRVGTCQNEKNTDLEERERENPKSIGSQVSFCSCLQKKILPWCFNVFQARRGECVK